MRAEANLDYNAYACSVCERVLCVCGAGFASSRRISKRLSHKRRSRDEGCWLLEQHSLPFLWCGGHLLE